MQEQDLNCYFENLKDVVEYLNDSTILDNEQIQELLLRAARSGEKDLETYLKNNFGMKILDFPNGGYSYFLP